MEKFFLRVSAEGVTELSLEERVSKKFAGIIELDPGGMVVLSTDVNATASGLKGVAKKILKTWYNRFMRSKKVDEAVKEELARSGLDSGWSIGNLFKGRYFSPKQDKQFDEKSFAVEIRGVPFSVVKEVGKGLIKKFDQESVLLVDFSNNRTMLMDLS